MTVNTQELRELLEKATPGPWHHIVEDNVIDAPSVPCLISVSPRSICTSIEQRDIDAAYIAAANPSTVAALLAEIDALRAELQARQWQPIETAPKDGTEILAWRDDCGQFIASYTSPSAFPLTQDELDQTDEETLFAKDWFTQWPQALRLEGSECPTAWMPLPPAPPQGDGA